MAQRSLMLFLEGAAQAGHPNKTAAYKATADGLFVRGVKVGKHGYVPSDEVQALITARVAGADDDEIRRLVERLHAARVEAAAAIGVKAVKPDVREPAQLANARARRAEASQ